MNLQRAFRSDSIATLAILVASVGWGTALSAQPAASPPRLAQPAVPRGEPIPRDRVVPRDEEDAEVLARGPVHEAFAETITFDPEPGIVVARGPPEAIEELPPEHRPEGKNVTWIPGYWAWDDDRDDFLWVSGVWRALPPGRQWVPGYWSKSGEGAQWTSGYWADAQLTETEYLPEPPESVEAGPSVAAPSADQQWLPGNWVWQENRYAWRPGVWSPVQQNWVWIPAHYQWAPRGYVYVDGYWDYSVARRGILFAPVRFSQRLYSQRGYSYTPSTVIDLGVFANHLFLRPNYGHYYYGDYYGANYASAGFSPWYSFNAGRRGYDPFYAHQRWNHRNDRNWERQVERDFQLRRSNEGFRPPHTFAAQRALAAQTLTDQEKTRVFALPLEQYARSKDVPVRIQPLKKEDRQQYGRLGKEATAYREERLKRETEAIEAKPPTKEAPSATRPQPARLKLPRSPYVAKRAEDLDKEFAPPKAYDFPKPDPKIVPRSRQRVARTPKAESLTTPRVTPPKVETAPPRTAPEAKKAPEASPPKRTPEPPPRERPEPAREAPKGKQKP